MTEPRETGDALLQRAVADLRTHGGAPNAVAELAKRIATPDAGSAAAPVRGGVLHVLKTHALLIGVGAGLIGSAWIGARHVSSRAVPAAQRSVETQVAAVQVREPDSGPVENVDAMPATSAGAGPVPSAPTTVDAQPRVHPSASTPGRQLAAATRRTETASAAPLRATATAELALLTAAQRVLDRDAARALALLEQHAREFPAGTFEEEREVLALEAQLKLRLREAARERARRFIQRFPDSAHAVRVRVLALGETLPR